MEDGFTFCLCLSPWCYAKCFAALPCAKPPSEQVACSKMWHTQDKVCINRSQDSGAVRPRKPSARRKETRFGDAARSGVEGPKSAPQFWSTFSQNARPRKEPNNGLPRLQNPKPSTLCDCVTEDCSGLRISSTRHENLGKWPPGPKLTWWGSLLQEWSWWSLFQTCRTLIRRMNSECDLRYIGGWKTMLTYTYSARTQWRTTYKCPPDLDQRRAPLGIKRA